jgi:hypothetical protein
LVFAASQNKVDLNGTKNNTNEESFVNGAV